MDAQDKVIFLLEQGDALRGQGRWAQAIRAYEEALALQPGFAAAWLNLALCYLAIGRNELAQEYASRIEPDMPLYWRARVILARAQAAQGLIEVAVEGLEIALQHAPGNPGLTLELADLHFQRRADAATARKLVYPLLEDPQHGAAALQTYVVASLYDRDESPEALVARIRKLAASWKISLPDRKRFDRAQGGRLRIGLISPYFCVSPVFFLTFGALQLLARNVDLVFFDRGSKADWAHEKFRRLSVEWVDTEMVQPAKLAEVLSAKHLDVLIDMAGWSDVDVLKALSARPAPKMYKWVGGQSATTGLDVFDGFVSDELQTPEKSQDLYAEKIVNIPTGYVTYTAPDYLPNPIPSRPDLLLLGVIGNPVKVSKAFVEHVCTVIRTVAPELNLPIGLQFIDSRYSQPVVRQRVIEMLRPHLDGFKRVAVLFTSPRSQADFFRHVARLSAVIDTFPYSAGLTALEAAAMGVPVLGAPGALCSERHAYSHWHFLGHPEAMPEFNASSLQALCRNAGDGRSARQFWNSLRVNHAALADKLMELCLS
jgi:predicted O-linked N-acetylglucosamine transferase (SPINDLY family)